MRDCEAWRPVPGFEDCYAVSDAGRVLSLERRCAHPYGTRRVRQRLRKVTLQMQRGKPSACIVKLSRPGANGEYHTVAKLVLLAFVGQPIGDQVAHHKDGDVTNAALSNVVWSTFSAIAAASGYKPPLRGRLGTGRRA